MNLSQFAAPRVFAPLQGLWRLMSPAPTTAARPAPHWRAHPVIVPATTSKTSGTASSVSHLPACQLASLPAHKAAAHKPLRVIRVLESDHLPANVGRMVISGRMADVCAELDRLADRAALH